ncbi:putative Glutamate synthase (NADH) [Rhodotorula taiwanensis]|uniref:Glutamate synthase [NADH] n=1 Tax=Rhodotorula taiwanensis TaxID=741276 RepID=A0A2S5BJD8_9BASI|nr:putative Glutamate synthase (NADH) [Rhodotorula taiwanensis]
MAPTLPQATELVNHQRTAKAVSFAEDTAFERSASNGSGNYGPHNDLDDDDEEEEEDHAANVVRDSFGNLPAKQGLYNPDEEKDACGVGFVCHIKGKPSRKIVSDARHLLCNMTHRGATGADARDGDGAGVMVGMPHSFFVREGEREIGHKLPKQGEYAVGNVFFRKPASPDWHNDAGVKEQQATFARIADELGLRVLGWRHVPIDNTILGPAALSREPLTLQPFVVLKSHYGAKTKKSLDGQPESGEGDKVAFDEQYFQRQLYVLRKQATHQLKLENGFYICSLVPQTIVYKGQLSPPQVYNYYHDLNHAMFASHFCLVHSRFSTNTFPSWDRAQPMRWAAHNGEINTVRGNKAWARSKEGNMQSAKFGDELEMLYPIVEAGGSDSAAFDNVLELLTVNGVLSLPEAVMLMIPEAWQNQPDMEREKIAFYQWASCLMEPWDGPALFTFSDGRYCGANLDRNGLRPCRWVTTNEDIMVCASEVGAITIEPEKITRKGRLYPGKMLLVDTVEGRIVDDKELKMTSAKRQPFANWIGSELLRLPDIVAKDKARNNASGNSDLELDDTTVSTDPRLLAAGYSFEQLDLLLRPLVNEGKEALGSMGNDAPLACMATAPRVMYDYFRQLFAQVTNPPIDPIREACVMSLESNVGNGPNILEMNAKQCSRLQLPSPLLSIDELAALRRLSSTQPDWTARTIDITFEKSEGVHGYERCLDRVCAEVSQAITDNVRIVILSDRAVSADRVAVSTAVAVGGVHHYLVRNKSRAKIALVAESAEAREVHHVCVLVGYGADAVCPYLCYEAMLKLRREGLLKGDLSSEQIIQNYRHAVDNGILKVMSKMGISVLASYRGAQVFEILGLSEDVVERCFVGTASRISGATFEMLALDALELHERGYPSRETVLPPGLPETGEYHWRDGGEAHINDPAGIASLQDAVREKNQKSYEAYSANALRQVRAVTLRGLLEFDYSKGQEIPLEQVEPWHEIVKRFVTGAMSYGSISMEAHSSLAIAMNRIGGKSNTGEGGEDAERSEIMPNGDTMRSAIKQIASGRFGVTANYLADADELQIKMAQGAKPGEGGELPGHKVSKSIARTRHSTAGVGLISPPPHHDIYSVEDLKELIYDLKAANPRARVSVKLVSEVGVGVVASGVAKARADHILVAGHDGGTGASRWTGIKYAGLPWELGLAETHQTLVLNDLRGRVTLQTDGQIRTGRDIAMGCIMMRKCHLNTCPVGIATQDPELRKKFTGTPEHVINFFYYVAEELRGIMAKLGFRTINEMVGRADMLRVDDSLRNPKTANLDLSALLKPAWQMRPGVATYKLKAQEHKLFNRLDNKFIMEAEPSLVQGLPTRMEAEVVNTDRALGTTLSNHVSKRYGEEGLPKDTIHISLRGSAGQSLGAFLAPGVTIALEGDSNDYLGKGLSGGRIIVFPPHQSTFKAEENIIVGNTCLYGATSGQAYIRGIAAERFAVRNSGATAVVEGCGDHGCEYMTGGRVVVLGTVGRNFAAGMSGGIAYVLDATRDFRNKVNAEMVELGPVSDPHEIAELRGMIEDHKLHTGSELAATILRSFNQYLPRFLRVMPLDYKAVLEAEAARAAMKKKQRSANLVKPTPIPAAQAAAVPIENGKHVAEPAVGDLEDSLVEGETAKKRVETLDKVKGFMKYKRLAEPYRNPRKRVQDWAELSTRLNDDECKVQTARCMDCGVPFCQSDSGCPISNIIPKWNDLVFKGQWRDALNRLLMTNNFPEFTGRVCPAPCEGACVLGINEQPVGIKSIECAIIDKGFEMGWMQPRVPSFRTGKRIAIVGSGPAGLAAADQLNKAGHHVTVYDRNDRFGGLLMYGIPNMKLDKRIVQRRIDLMAAEGISFVNNAHVGVTHDIHEIRAENDALIMATGATWPRDLRIKGREGDGIHFAMEFLQKNTKSLLDSNLEDDAYLSAKGKKVVVVGGGDTGNDCIGTSLRHGAVSVVNFELLPQPPSSRAGDNPWPQWPKVFRTDYGHSEVAAHFGKDPREYSISTKSFERDENGVLKGLNTVRVQWEKDAMGAWRMSEVPDSEEFFPADLVLLALGFLGPEASAIKALGLDQDARSNLKTPAGKYTTNAEGVFAAGDCRRGQSLIVWGINEGRSCAAEVDRFLTGDTRLPNAGSIKTRSFTPAKPLKAAIEPVQVEAVAV